MEFKDYTVKVYKMDKRTKKGERLVHGADHPNTNKQNLEHLYRTTWFAKDGYRFEIVETYRDVMNPMTGKTVRERYDTPYSCSVASDAYWQN
jgi:hypothetical protein